MVVEELLTILGFEGDTEELDKFQKNIDSTKSSIKGLAVVFASAVGTVGTWIGSAVAAGDAVAKQADEVNSSIEAYQSYRFAAGQAGVANGTFDQSLKKLNSTLGQASKGNKKAQETFGELGVSVKNADGSIRSSDEVLGDLNNKFSKISDPALRAKYAVDLFGESGARMGQFLGTAPEDLDATRKKFEELGGTITTESARASEAFGDLVDDALTFVGGLKNEVAFALLPTVSEFVEIAMEWARANREVIQEKLQSFLSGLISIIKTLGGVIWFVMKTVNSMVEAMGGWEKVLHMVGIILAVIAATKAVITIMALVKVFGALGLAIQAVGIKAAITQAIMFAIPIAIGLAIVALGLLIDDLYHFFTGGESLIGEYIDDILDGLMIPFDMFLNYLENYADVFIEYVIPFEALRSGLRKMKNAIFGFFRGLMNSVRNGNMLEFLFEQFESFKTWIFGIWDSIGNKISSVIQGALSKIQPFIDKAKKVGEFLGFGGGTPSVAPGQTARTEATNRTQNNVDVNSNIQIGVPPGTSEEQLREVEKASKKAVQSEWDRILRESDAEIDITE
jgi:hypothetical protein